MTVKTGGLQLAADLLRAGHDALARGDWQEARDCFAAALEREVTPEVLEGLGMAAWWLDDATTTFQVRERAYGVYRDAGDVKGAARVAVCLAGDHSFFRGESAVANGWSRRARRLLADHIPCAEHAMLAICEGDLAFFVENDPFKAGARGAEASALAHSLGLIDLEMLGRALEGLALVSQGQVDEGMTSLDEAATAAISGEMTGLEAITWTCCFLIFACERVRDYDRAAQWCDAVKRITAQRPYRLMFALCRAHFAGVLVRRGAWQEAERELEAAIAGLDASRPAIAAEAISRLADLRRRQGRLDEAAALLHRLESPPLRMLGARPALLARAALALDQGDAATAAGLAKRYLRSLPAGDRFERGAGLEILVRASVDRSELGAAAAALAELHLLAAAAGTPAWIASVVFVDGLVTAASDLEAARGKFEDTIDLFERSGAPFEAAQTRIELARVLSALGRETSAELEARLALEVFQNLGAAREAGRAALLLRQVRTTKPRQAAGLDALGFTPRELDVLRLLASGMSNQEIASGLVLSVRTVERHISSIYEKAGARGKVARAVATAYALTHGLTLPPVR